MPFAHFFPNGEPLALSFVEGPFQTIFLEQANCLFLTAILSSSELSVLFPPLKTDIQVLPLASKRVTR